MKRRGVKKKTFLRLSPGFFTLRPLPLATFDMIQAWVGPKAHYALEFPFRHGTSHWRRQKTRRSLHAYIPNAFRHSFRKLGCVLVVYCTRQYLLTTWKTRHDHNDRRWYNTGSTSSLTVWMTNTFFRTRVLNSGRGHARYHSAECETNEVALTISTLNLGRGQIQGCHLQTCPQVRRCTEPQASTATLQMSMFRES